MSEAGWRREDEGPSAKACVLRLPVIQKNNEGKWKSAFLKLKPSFLHCRLFRVMSVDLSVLSYVL